MNTASSVATTLLLTRRLALHTSQRRWLTFVPYSTRLTSQSNGSHHPAHPPSYQTRFVVGLPQKESRRGMARSSDSTEDSPEKKARTFIISLGHEAKIADRVVEVLRSSGLSGGALLSTVRQLAGRVEVGEDAGLEPLIESVRKDLARSEGKKIITLHVVPPSAWSSEEGQQESEKDRDIETMLKSSFVVKGYEGMTITDVAKFGDLEGSSTLGENIECACSGIMACSTCHVIIQPEWFDKVGEAEPAEQDMIDLAYNPKETSRLGCQVELKPELDGMIVKLPRGANNMMDFIPFEDKY